MKVFATAALLSIATAFITFVALAFMINPNFNTDMLSLNNPAMMLVDAIGVAGLIFAAMAARQLFAIHQRLAAR
jgi:hypothetical protein